MRLLKTIVAGLVITALCAGVAFSAEKAGAKKVKAPEKKETKSESTKKPLRLINFDNGEIFNDLDSGVKASLAEGKGKGGKAACKLVFKEGECWVTHELKSKIDWSAYTYFKFHVKSELPAAKTCSFIVADQDEKDGKDRCSLSFSIKPGESDVSIEIAGIISYNKKAIDLTRIKKFGLFYTNDWKEDDTIYISDIRLEADE